MKFYRKLPSMRSVLPDGVMAIGLITLVHFSAAGQTPSPFTCQTGIAYVTRTSAAANTNTGLYTFDHVTGAYVAVAEPILAGSTVNAVGFNPLDNFVWGAVGGSNTLVKIGANGQTQTFTVTGLPVGTYEAGDIDGNGNLYLFISGTSSIYKISLTTPTPTLVTTFTYADASNFSDFSVSADGTVIRAIRGNSDMATITLSGTTATQAVTTTNLPAGILWNMFKDSDGNLYCQNRTNGNFYLISAPHYNFGQLLQSGGGAVFNSDAASCPSVALTSPLTPFACTNLQYQVTATSATGASTLWQYNAILGTRTSIAVLPGYMNAIGYNATDNFIWGITDVGGGVTLAKVDAAGKWVQYKIPGLPTTSVFHVGDVSKNGYFFVYTSGETKYYVIDVNPTRPTYLQLVNPLTNYQLYEIEPLEAPMNPTRTISDWAFNPVDSHLYAVTDPDAGTPYRIVKLNPLTGVSTLSAAAVTGGGFQTTTSAYGANFFDNEGNFYVVSNTTGLFYRVDLTTAAATRLSASGIGVNFNDGAGCVNAAMTATDLADASDSYGTLLNSNGPAHIVSANLMIGNRVDDELDGQPAADADGDDLNGAPNDEDGVLTIPDLIAGASTYNLTVRVTNTTGSPATLAGWVDFNGNGSFQTGERAEVNVPNGATSVQLAWTGVTGIAPGGNNFIRLRIAGNSSEITLPTGPASNGEVEDYRVGVVPLPVNLVSVSVRPENMVSVLEWTTSSESHADRFEIERSGNANIWDTVGEVAAAGESTQIVDYRFVDAMPLAGQNYYRLRMVDHDGTFAFSKIVTVRFDGTAAPLKIYPNPTKVILNIENVDFGQVNDITLVDPSGRSTYRFPKAPQIAVDKVPPGSYILRVNFLDGSNASQRVVVDW